MLRWTWLMLVLTAAACSPDYPFDKPGTWSLDQLGGANDANLRVMVANPRDLVAGAGENTSVGVEAATPVHKLFTGRRAQLPPLNTLDVNVIPLQQPQPEQGGPNAGQ